MIADPYRILGVASSATDDEIKKAYRALSKKYHPDANLDHQEQAEEKFKEVQEAYQQIVAMREKGTSSFGFGQQWNADRTKSGYGEDSVDMQAARDYINAGYYQEALNILNRMGAVDQSARWYYYSAVANAGIGNNTTAFDHAQRAVALEPYNLEYQLLLSKLQQGSSWYREKGSSYGRSSLNTNLCLEFCCMNLLCGCCCRSF
jgi:molecular chaperone DnaJ